MRQLSIEFTNGHIRTKCGGWTGGCDIYFIVKVKGDKDYRTKSGKITGPPSDMVFGEEIETDHIKKNSEITIEMWDDDSASADDELGVWTLPLSEIGKVTRFSNSAQNKLNIKSRWIE